MIGHSKSDSRGESAMGPTAAKKKTLKTMYHATMLVTRTEEWCVEAETVEEARQLLSAGDGHKCHVGDPLHVELRDLVD
jgi:hypothetical protein